MLHFFRKIRRDLLANSQSASPAGRIYKYLKYAIGEIVLVVLGILIALYINNQNEQRKDREKFDQTLVEVEKELINNISSVRAAILFHAYIDSILLNVAIDTIKIEDFNNRTGQGIRFAMATAQFPAIQDESSLKLSQSNNMTKEQSSILSDLKYLSSIGTLYWEVIEEVLSNRLGKIEQHFIGFDWYYNWLIGDFDDMRIVDYLLNDTEFKNLTLEVLYGQGQHLVNLNRYDRIGMDVYLKIHNYLDSLGINHQDSLQFQYNPNNFNHYVGKYRATWCSDKDFVFDDSIAITVEEDKLIYYEYRSDGPDTKLEIIPINEFRFRTKSGGGVYHLNFDDNGEVQGIRFSGNTMFIYSMKKIR